MILKLHLAVFCLLLFSISNTFAGKQGGYFGNLPPLKFLKSQDVNIIEESNPVLSKNIDVQDDEVPMANTKDVQNEQNMLPDNTVMDDFKMEHKIEEIEDDDKDKVISAVGSSMSNLAVLVPANLSVLQKSNVHPQHIIGYVPFNSPNGQAFVLPAGAVRIVGQNQPQMHFAIGRLNMGEEKSISQKEMQKSNEEEEPIEEERGLRKRRRVRKRNAKAKLRRNRHRRGNNRRRRNSRRKNKKTLRSKHKNINKRRRNSSNRRQSNSKRKHSNRRKNNRRGNS